jgi:hypothetical protein
MEKRRRSAPPWDEPGRPRERRSRRNRGGEGSPPVKVARPSLDSLRRSPVRNGLIGLAVAGAATPIAIDRYQQALRTDPAHERVASGTEPGEELDAEQVGEAHAAMESARGASAMVRERILRNSVRKYADYDLTRELAEQIYDIALESNVDPEVAFGLVRAESSFKNTSTSHVGAVGLAQLMPRTAAWLVPGTTVSDLRNPDTNLRIGMKYLRQLIDKYSGDVDLALTAYNRGPGTVDRILGTGGNPDNGYAGFVKTGNLGQHEG